MMERRRRGARLRAGLGAGLIGVLLATGCESTQGLSKTQKGAILGGIAGAAAGRAIGGHENAAAGIAIGAVSGAVAGGLIGRYLDRQAQEIDAIPDANVQRAEDRLVVTFAGDLLFDSGSSRLSPGAQQRLGQLSDTLARYPESRIIVKGHTDSIGSESFNLRLSEERAHNVRNYLIAEGLSPDRVTALGFGEQFPLTSNETGAGRQQNRRVEIEIVPIEERLRDRESGSTY